MRDYPTPSQDIVLILCKNEELNFSYTETGSLIEFKLYINNHWMVPYKVCIFCVDQKSELNDTLFNNGQ